MSEAAPGTRAQEVIARLNALHPVLIDLSLGRLQHLLARLGHPERRLPPVIHVAGTNGKGSTCAFLRAIGEASGRRVHVYTSPHLVRFNERIRLAGRLVSDLELTETIEHLERVSQGDPISIFEMITAAAFFLFAAYPADLAVVEVGLGGRSDATNVIPPPAAAAITSISLDHQEFLGDTLARIAFEKAGIIKPQVPVVTGEQPPEVLSVIANVARQNQAPLFARGSTWQLTSLGESFRFQDPMGTLELPAPALPGLHQLDNAGIALAALGAAGIAVPESACAAGLAGAVWPARLQCLTGRLAARLPPGFSLWLDGGHNPAAGAALATHLESWRAAPVHLVVGMKTGKDSAGFLAPLLPLATSVYAVSEPGQHLARPVGDIIAASGGIARPGPTVASALAQIGRDQPPGRVLICGSLYLAGEVLKQDGD